MDRRDFIKYGAVGVATVAIGTSALSGPLEALAATYRTSGKAWKFGVMADTQWKSNLDGKNPGSCAVGIINALNAQFIARDVKFVIQVGDLVDKETDSYNGSTARTLPVRVAATQALYDAGIGFFPLRGNHESSQLAALELPQLFPQTLGSGSNVFGAENFASPMATLNGLSYAFDFGNVRLVMLDQFTRTDNTNYLGSTSNNIVDQLPWIEEQLAGRSKDTHAFVLSHKNLTGGNHKDCLFGDNPTTNLAARNDFISTLAENNVRYQIGGHDHMHHRSIIENSDRSAATKQLICSSNSYKFYVPARPSNDAQYNFPTLERMLAEELWTIGYYVFTVDGPRLTVEYFAASTGIDYGDIDLTTTPENLVFFKREAWGYSLNGKEFAVAQGDSYSVVADSYKDTEARILGGTNAGAETDYAKRPLLKTVNTGWAGRDGSDTDAASDTLSIWGIANSLALWDEVLTGTLPNADNTDTSDTFVLQMSYDNKRSWSLGNGRFGIATLDADGKTWVNAVDRNFGGTKEFVKGAWQEGYGLGTYGVDASTKTVWAVVNHEGDFMVRRGIEA